MIKLEYETGLRLDDIIQRLEFLRVDMEKLKKAANISDKKKQLDDDLEEDLEEEPKRRRR